MLEILGKWGLVLEIAKKSSTFLILAYFKAVFCLLSSLIVCFQFLLDFLKPTDNRIGYNFTPEVKLMAKHLQMMSL